jgi:mono/diheme cytochrome c family protein
MNARKLYAAAAGWLGAGVVLSLVFAAVALVDSPAQAGTAGIFDPATLNTTDGRQIFEQICQGCHMHNGQGAVGARP